MTTNLLVIIYIHHQALKLPVERCFSLFFILFLFFSVVVTNWMDGYHPLRITHIYVMYYTIIVGCMALNAHCLFIYIHHTYLLYIKDRDQRTTIMWCTFLTYPRFFSSLLEFTFSTSSSSHLAYRGRGYRICNIQISGSLDNCIHLIYGHGAIHILVSKQSRAYDGRVWVYLQIVCSLERSRMCVSTLREAEEEKSAPTISW